MKMPSGIWNLWNSSTVWRFKDLYVNRKMSGFYFILEIIEIKSCLHKISGADFIDDGCRLK